MKRFLTVHICLTALIIVQTGCNRINSSELKSTKAQDVKMTATVKETNTSNLAQVHSLLRTLNSNVGIQFDEGQTLTASSEASPGNFNASTFLGYENNFLDLGEQYVAYISEAPLGLNYQISYKDADDVVTSISFSSDGVPDLITPVANQEIPLNQSTPLSWISQNLGALTVRVDYDTVGGGMGIVWLSTSDTGNYNLDLSSNTLSDVAPGNGTISLIHYTTYDQMPGFAAADVQVKSVFEQDVEFKNAGVQGQGMNKAMSNAQEPLDAEETFEACALQCGENVKKIIMVDGEKVNCCL